MPAKRTIELMFLTTTFTPSFAAHLAKPRETFPPERLLAKLTKSTLTSNQVGILLFALFELPLNLFKLLSRVLGFSFVELEGRLQVRNAIVRFSIAV